MEPITGKTLLGWGYEPGPWFKQAIAMAEVARVEGKDEAAIRAIVARCAPQQPADQAPLRPAGELTPLMNIRAESPEEEANVAQVEQHMRELMRVPTVVSGAVMPDACVAGSAPGTIPVGGVVATKDAIHPGMHSADICCSMAMTVFKAEASPALAKRVLDAGMALSHFGGGGRPRGKQIRPPHEVMWRFEANELLSPFVSDAIEHFATQGDGNHFFYVGRLSGTGELALVTHHGSRKPGAMLYKRGMAIAEKVTRKISPETPKHNAWIPAESKEGFQYWQALQIIRDWTKLNHFMIHDMIREVLGLQISGRMWNEHNFVFRRGDLFYHGKGATPAWRDYAHDATGYTLIPLNMAEPILIVEGKDAVNGLGFAPHGAGRNFSRKAYTRQLEGRSEADVLAEQTKGLDVRFFSGILDLSELPGAYKSAEAVRRQIDEFGLARVVETVEPIGTIMAGDWQRNAPWKRRGKGAHRTADIAGGQ